MIGRIDAEISLTYFTTWADAYLFYKHHNLGR